MRWTVGAVILAVSLFGCADSQGSDEAETHRAIRGDVVLSSSAWRLYPDGSCDVERASGFDAPLASSLRHSTAITVRPEVGQRQTGVFLGTRHLEHPTGSGPSLCLLTFVVNELPDADSYELHIERLYRGTLSRDQLIDRDWYWDLCRGTQGRREYVPCDY